MTLHPLCRGHHLLKTNRNITITTSNNTRTGDSRPGGKNNTITYEWTSTTAPTGFTHTVDPPPDLINAAQARHIIDEHTPPIDQDTTAPYHLEKNLPKLTDAEHALPAIADLEHLLAGGGLLPPRPERKLTTWEELDILYRIAHPDHTTPRPKTWRPKDWVPWAHHRTRAQIITDPWRHTTPPIDHQTEYETDLPPF
ncbi:hypothetical protein [Brevibacterium moorei]|uniref:hypothetical protein n=1 Tax=Brevibacterium moorei TaxID=2968457 RepID=UPI00211CCB91|nr:hypothetical protein [Brevibacterium sp. 68QC2CO]MCQ9385503.1 hypothetical protein [Brevibacterium sp. 68QC2CO]